MPAEQSAVQQRRPFFFFTGRDVGLLGVGILGGCVLGLVVSGAVAWEAVQGIGAIGQLIAALILTGLTGSYLVETRRLVGETRAQNLVIHEERKGRRRGQLIMVSYELTLLTADLRWLMEDPVSRLAEAPAPPLSTETWDSLRNDLPGAIPVLLVQQLCSLFAHLRGLNRYLSGLKKVGVPETVQSRIREELSEALKLVGDCDQQILKCLSCRTDRIGC